ncbi:helix-turn-helix transcriptional regulator [Streptomyces sp. NPDC018031]|uniref:helix-turn-helix transcriptional regulator n=1 Tax=Streptomyces sp. NPDC018031 TaxID=3365033 RepID=UPI003796E143
MASRTAPTYRQRRLATELRRLREQAGLTAQQAAALLGTDRTMVAHIEAARTKVNAERVRQLACNYACPNDTLVEGLAAMADARRDEHWWDEYRGKLPDGFLDISEIEYYATRIRTAQTVHLPGLLQTEEHARALFELVVPKLRRLDVELRVAHRMERQAIFARDDPTPYVGIVHEAALRMQFGGRDVTREQLTYLAEAADRENITLRVIPFSAGSFHGAGQSVLYAEGPEPQLDTVQLDSAYGPYFTDSPTPLANYRALLDLMESSALSPSESQTLIKSIARDV